MVSFFAALRGQSRQVALEDDAGLEHLPGLKSMQSAYEAEGGLADIGGTISNKGSYAVADLHDPHRGQVADACPKARPADFEGERKLALRRNLVAWLQSAVFNESANVVHHLHRAVAAI